MAALLAVLVTVSAMAAPGQAASVGSAQRAAQATVRTTALATAQRSAPCRDVVVVGIDGNGERPASGATFGPTVSRTVSAYAASLGSRSVLRLRVPVSTAALSVMVDGYDRRRRDAGDAVRRKALRSWQGPIGTQVQAAARLIAERAATCPDEQLALVGYAQGASVVHRLLDREASAGRLGRVAGAVLVSDPDRRYQTRSHLTGAPSAVRASTGIIVHRFSPPPDDVPGATATFGVGTVCTFGDLVCDPGATSVRRAFAVARGYATTKGGGAAIRRETASLATRTRLQPVPAPATQLASGTAGEPLSHQLTVDVASSARPGVTWTATSEVPGLTLSPTGLLTGTPSDSGSYSMTYTVRGTAPATGSRSGVLSIVVAAPAAGVAGLGAGGQTSCQTRADGTAYCWGRNDYGQIGDGTTTRRLAPTKVLGGDWAQVVTGGAASCGIKSTGRLSCWGLNNYGQVGTGQSRPVLKPRVVGTGTWSDVSLAWHHACGVMTDSSLWCWGQNLRGSLGLGRTSRSADQPRRVDAATWRSVATGGWHSCGIRTDGSAWCWGDNQLGQLGLGNVDRQVSPRRVGAETDNWLQLSTGYGHTCGVRADGTLWCWGLNDRGQLGDGTQTLRTRPTAVLGGGAWTSVAVADGSTCAVAGGGAVWCWGDNRYGLVSPTASTAPVLRPVRRAAPTGVSSVTAGWLHACAARTDQVVTCWGSNEVGQAASGGAGASGRTTAGGYDARPGIESDPEVSPAEVVERAIGSRPRPAVSARAATGATPGGMARSAAVTSRLMTFNVLGTQHTAPGGDRPDWAPGRIRAEWAGELIRARDADLLGLQESQPDQIGSLDLATGGKFGFYPGNELGYSGAPQSVMWRKDTWSLRWKDTISVPFMDGRRPQPIVRLRNNASGKEIYLVNVHLSPGGLEADRDRGTKILIMAVKELSKDQIPVLLTGDFNEHEELYCKVVGQTDLVAALGPSTSPDRCVPPRGIRVDQIFGSRGRFSGLRIEQGAMVQRTTDHSVSVVSFTMG